MVNAAAFWGRIVNAVSDMLGFRILRRPSMKRCVAFVLALLFAGTLLISATAQSVPESTSIAALQRELQKQTPGAMNSFWTRVAVEGAPLIEKLDDDQQSL